GGRPLLDDASNPVVAEFRPGDAWVDGTFAFEGPAAVLEEAARQWLSDAAMEHASVASFGRVALELMALGAPPDLLEQSHKAALDEIRHAKTCLAIAVACGGAPVQPDGLPPCPLRPPELPRFAADTFVEGCVGETTAALVMERAAAGASDPGLQQALAQIAQDESAHAALAWRTVAWALERGGPAVLRSVQARAEELRQTHGRSAPAKSDGALAPFGRLDEAARHQARHDAWFGIVEPMLQTLTRSA
ncbi:MAG: ferritin-like domain-containing protein, partial [Myxococcota bacterium]